jgi:hypothetical protein
LIEDATMATISPRTFTSTSQRLLIATALTVAVAVGIGISVRPAHAAEAPVYLGAAESYGVLGGQEVTNTGPTVVTGDLGVSPGTSVSGFLPGTVLGTIHAGDAHAALAQLALTAAYLDAEGRPLTLPATAWTELGNQSFGPGVYAGGALTITGDVTLVGDAASVFIFKASSSLTTASASRVLLSGPINPCNVFWQVDSTAILGSGSSMVGTVMALTSINAETGATVSGRLLARNGATTLDNNVITRPLACAAAPPATPVPGEATFAG